MLTVRQCPNVSCGLVDKHPVRWCSNCGSEFKTVQMEQSEFNILLAGFELRTGKDPEFGTNFDPDTGKPWPSQNKESK